MGWYPLGHRNEELLGGLVFERFSKINQKSLLNNTYSGSFCRIGIIIAIPEIINPEYIWEYIEIFELSLNENRWYR